MNTIVAVCALAAALAGFTITGYVTIITIINRTERNTMSLQQAIDTLVEKFAKAHDEIVNKLETVQNDLQAQIDAAGVTEQVDLSALTAIAQQLDDIVPDEATVTEAVTEAVEEATDEPADTDEDTDTDEPVTDEDDE